MNIILGDVAKQNISSNYVVLELDRIKIIGLTDPITAYCVVESVPIGEIFTLEKYQDLHANLMKEYYKGNYDYCEDAISYLIGKWNGELDSFYHTLISRIKDLRKNDISIGPVIDKTL